MKITLGRMEVKKAITLARQGLPEKPLSEAEGHIRFVGEEDALLISGTDRQKSSYCRVPAKDCPIGETFSCDPKRIEKVLNKGSADEVTLDFSKTKMEVKLYVSGDSKSRITLKVTPEQPRIKVDKPLEDASRIEVSRKILETSIRFTANFLPDTKVNDKRYDYIQLNNGIVSAANGMNKRGYFVCPALKGIEHCRLRKMHALTTARFLSGMQDDNIVIVHDKRVTGVESIDGLQGIYFLNTKDETPAPKVEYIRAEGDYIEIDRKEVISAMERVSMSSYQKSTDVLGLDLIILGSEDSASLRMRLATSQIDTEDNLPCVRKGQRTQDISHVVDYKLFRTILQALKGSGVCRFYLCEPDTKFFKMYDVREIEETQAILVGVGAYSRVVK